jgi:sn-glycerol 3-phosphate transport system permease protein
MLPKHGKARDAVIGWLLVLPAVALLASFTHWPTVLTIWSSLHTKPVPGHPSVFDPADNFESMWDDPVFWQALSNNAFYAAVLIPSTIVLALVMALAVNRRMPGRAFLRLAYFTPTVLPMIAVANIWLFFFTPGYGLFARVLAPFGLGSFNWLGNPATALPAVTMIAVWKEAGFYMIFYLAALQSLPVELAEAAALEGASRAHYFRRVMWPLLMPTTLFVFVNVTIDAFRLIDQVVVLTRGGPDNATLLLLYYVYQVSFQYFDENYASALTMVLVAVLGLVAILQFGVIGRRVHYR